MKIEVETASRTLTFQAGYAIKTVEDLKTEIEVRTQYKEHLQILEWEGRILSNAEELFPLCFNKGIVTLRLRLLPFSILVMYKTDQVIGLEVQPDSLISAVASQAAVAFNVNLEDCHLVSPSTWETLDNSLEISTFPMPLGTPYLLQGCVTIKIRSFLGTEICEKHFLTSKPVSRLMGHLSDREKLSLGLKLLTENGEVIDRNKTLQDYDFAYPISVIVILPAVVSTPPSILRKKRKELAKK